MAQSLHVQCHVGRFRAGGICTAARSNHLKDSGIFGQEACKRSARWTSRNAKLCTATLSTALSKHSPLRSNGGSGPPQSQPFCHGVKPPARKHGITGSATSSDDAKKIEELLAINEQLQTRIAELEAAVGSQSPLAVTEAVTEPEASVVEPVDDIKGLAEAEAPVVEPVDDTKTLAEAEAPVVEPVDDSKTLAAAEAPVVEPEDDTKTLAEAEAPVVEPEDDTKTSAGAEAPVVEPKDVMPPPQPEAPAMPEPEPEPQTPSREPSKAKNIEWPSPTDPVPFWERPVTPLTVDAAGPEVGEIPQDPNPMHIVHVTAEMAPLAKVGGLGDVVTGLARACLARGHRVEVLLPFYECIDTAQVADLQPGEEYNSFHRGGWVNLQVFRGAVSGVPVLFFKPANHFFRGSRIYGGSYDELEAYLFFSRAVLEYFQVMGQQPDVIHIHEWHTSGLALLYWDMYHSLGLTRPRIALTIHNMEHHGECRREQLDMCGLDGGSYLVPDKAIDDRTVGHNPERGSLLKGGIVYSNVVTTVSPTYAEETLCSGWLASTLMRNRDKYHGVLNGIDTVLWDPERDPHLPATFNADDLEGKCIVKHYVQRGLGLATDLQSDPGSPTGFSDVATRQPLVVCVTRLVAQKGVHLIRHAIFRTSEQGGQFVLLGSAPDPRIQAEFQGLADQFRDSDSVRLLLTYSEPLAHLLFAAADVLLVPSMFEPCGLTQMIAMRYGTIPVVRRTGGLADTVFDVDNQSDQERANGYVFDGIGEGDLNSALDRTLRQYKDRPQEWDALAAKVMKIDNSWNKSAGQYVQLYSSIRA